MLTIFGGDSHRIQTCNLLIRSQMLYSVELASLVAYGDSHRIQTCNLLIRSQMLYSVELASLNVCNALTTHRPAFASAKVRSFF